MANPYESDQLLAEYLLFHYGSAEETLPYPFGPREALGFPIRCVSECLDRERLPRDARALDLGCAVGRSTFELARYCRTSIGIDASHRFITAAASLQRDGACGYARRDEGDLSTSLVARVPAEIDRRRVRFALGDATMLPLGDDPFDVVLLANLIDRLPEPGRCLEQLSRIIKPGGQLIITSPYTWLEEFTPREHWLGGCAREGRPTPTFIALEKLLSAAFTLTARKDLAFLIREHARKFQWSVADATVWIRNSG